MAATVIRRSFVAPFSGASGAAAIPMTLLAVTGWPLILAHFGMRARSFAPRRAGANRFLAILRPCGRFRCDRWGRSFDRPGTGLPVYPVVTGTTDPPGRGRLINVSLAVFYGLCRFAFIWMIFGF